MLQVNNKISTLGSWLFCNLYRKHYSINCCSLFIYVNKKTKQYCFVIHEEVQFLLLEWSQIQNLSKTYFLIIGRYFWSTTFIDTYIHTYIHTPIHLKTRRQVRPVDQYFINSRRLNSVHIAQTTHDHNIITFHMYRKGN